MEARDWSDPDFRAVYDELRALARRRLRQGLGGASLQATALVHEVWVKLSEERAPATRDDSHFYATAAQAMRWILVDRARRRRRVDAAEGPASFSELQDPAGQEQRDRQTLALDVALEKLERAHPRMAAVVLQRHFAGLSVEQAARVLGLSTATVKREWRFARAWLLRELSESADS